MSARVKSPASLAALLGVDDAKALADRLEAYDGAVSPFAALDTVHFARLQMVGRLTPRRAGKRLAGSPSYLFFAAELDGTVDGFLEALPVVAPKLLENVFECCTGFPGVSRPTLVATWLRRHEVTPGFSVHGHPDATVTEIRTALALRERLIAFGLRTRDHNAAAFARAWEAQRW